MEDLATLIRNFRHRLDLTQPQLALKLDVSESSVRHWEGNGQNVGPSALMKLLWLAERADDKEFAAGVTLWQDSASAQRVAKIRERKDDIRPTVKALAKNLIASAETCGDLAKRAPEGTHGGDKLVAEFEKLQKTLADEADRLSYLYEILSKIRENEKETLRVAAMEGR